MKNLTKIFLIVAALMAFSCATDATDDLGVQVGNGEDHTEFVLSLEESRTQLGEKAGELYPLFWSEGDKISVNGVESAEATIGDNGTVATFAVPGVLSAPYCITYPVAPANQVVFAAQQTHVSNTTFASGVSTMYAYSEEGTGVAMQHLTGVLKIGVVGSEKLVLAQVSNVNRAPIAGAFAFDFEKGEATATELSKEVIEYSFGEGVQLSSEPTYLHVAVPAGEYDELYVTLYDENGGVMYATVKSDKTKPLKAGNVREFSNNVVYTPSESLFVIKDKASLKAFAEQAATLEKDVLFVADIDMTGEEWIPIDGYVGTVRGNGYAIKGLTAPLFGAVTASIKGLHLRDVNIHETETPKLGALARDIEAKTGALVVENCSVTGEIVIDCPQYTHVKDASQYRPYSIGSLLGVTYGVEVKDCWSDTDLEVKQVIASSNTTTIYPCVGGVVGNVNEKKIGDVTYYGSVSNLENKGDITFADASYQGETSVSKYSPVNPYFGGVIGSSGGSNATAITQIVNRGNITLKGNYGSSTRLSGTISNLTIPDGSHFYNYGKITYAEGKVRYIYIGGAAGYCGKKTALENIHNYGAVEVAEGTLCASIVCGGLIAYQPSDYVAHTATHSYIKNGSNNAPISVYSSTITENPNHTNLYYRVGGLSGWTQHLILNCNNEEKGVVTCRGTVHNEDTSNYSVCIGGLVGYKTVNAIDESYNKGAVICDVNMTKGEDATWDTTSDGKTTTNVYDKSKVRMNLGGIAGYSNLPCRDVVNHAAVTASGTYEGQLRMGGIGGHIASTSGNIPSNDNCVNNGAVTVKANTTIADVLQLGGCGFVSKYQNLTNNGDITVESGVTVGGIAYIGGAFGYQSVASTGAYNTGKVTLKANSEFKSELYVAGCGGFINADITTAENKATGTVTVEDIEVGVLPHIAGGIAYASAIASNGTSQSVKNINDVINRGAVDVNINTEKDVVISVGGCFGEAAEGTYTGQTTLRNATVKNLANYGPITITSTNSYNYYVGGLAYFIGGPLTNGVNHETGTVSLNVVTRSNISVGGLAYRVKDSATDSHNKATVTIAGSIGGTTYLAGSIVTNNNYTRTRTNNEGDIIVKATVAVNSFIGGMVYDSGAKMIYNDCHNSGNFTLEKEGLVKGHLRWGGLVGKLEAADSASDPKYNVFNGCSNSGNIHIKGTINAYLRLGGLIGCYTDNYPFIIVNGFTNSGNIIDEGTHPSTNYIQLGGVFGYVGEDGSRKPVYSNSTYPSWTGDVINTGEVAFKGTTKGYLRIGGIFGGFDSATPPACSLINFGNLTLEGTHGGDAGATGVGGITGDIKGNYTIDGGQSFCDIKAIGITRVGAIVGSTRSDSKKVVNCKAGGRICKERDSEDESDKWITLNTSNWFDLIYGSVDWTGVENYDGCSLLNSKDDVTYYVAPEETPAQ